MSETYYYKRGSNQQFSQTYHIFDPSNYSEEELSYDLEKEIIPIAIHCIAEEGMDGNFSLGLFRLVLLKKLKVTDNVRRRNATIPHNNSGCGSALGWNLRPSRIETEAVRGRFVLSPSGNLRN